VACKGVEGLYEYCCDHKFYEWVLPKESSERPPRVDQKYICMAPIFYKDDLIFGLREDKYISTDEEESSWKIAIFSEGTRDTRLPHRPYKIFQLEKDDDLLVLKSKIRPVLVINKIASDWRKPYNYFFNSWLCLPLFSYKKRHPQKYVISDQELNVPHRFYFPPGTPGIEEESCGQIIDLQSIPEVNLYPFTCFCDTLEPRMGRPIKLGDRAFSAVMGHVARFLPGIEITGESLEWYAFFRELVREQIAKYVSD
jgi:hypothetical protein